MVRLVFVASILLPGPQLLVYLALWLAMPAEGSLGAAQESAALPGRPAP